MKLTGLVIATDEERDLPACLESLAFCDELVVIDGGSTDGTVDAALDAGARVIANPWPGYAAQRRFGLAAARGEWVLAVDADERVDDELRRAVGGALASEAATQAAGFRVRVRAWLFGRPLRFGGMGHDDHLRLFRRAQVKIEAHAVHERFAVDGPTRLLPGTLIHRSFASLTEAALKAERYSSLAAREQFNGGRRMSRAVAALRLPWAFLRRYLLFLGFLDGYPGFVNAALLAYADFLKGAKLRELVEARAGEQAASGGPLRPG
jgi:glycosyltransferase involved in cell wall biosynthesis